jgi:FixJ family two-component response regulator
MVTASGALVSVVDDDESVRELLPGLLTELGFATRAFASAEEFLASDVIGQTKCLVLDIAMPGMTGLELQQELMLRRQHIPIIFITAISDENLQARVVANGAVECRILIKPFSETALIEALEASLRVR